jgi:hypothetical protein
MLEGWLDHPATALAYPNGNHNPAVIEASRAAGYRTGFLFDHRLAADPPTDPLTISRVRVAPDVPAGRFASVTAGVHPVIHHARGRT